MKKYFTLVLAVLTAFSLFFLVSCKDEKEEVDGSYDFIIYAPDSNNTDITDNTVIATYHIEYKDCSTVTDTLIKSDNNIYKFSSDSDDYLVLENGLYGLYYTYGYFKDYSECSSGQIDVLWSLTLVNGSSCGTAIGETPLEGLETFGFVINGCR